MAAEPAPAASGSDGHKSFGERVTRLEDPALITGRGRFADDIRLPGAAHAAFVRSPHAHALIRSIESSAARAIDGVVAIYTLDDFRPCLAMERMAVGLPSPSYRQERDRPVLADGEVLHVGEPVAIVVAESRYIAEDAAALVDVVYDLLPAVADCRESLKPGADLVHRDAPHNELAAFDLGYGDVRGVFASAPHVYSESFWQHRGGSHSIEGRGCVAVYDDVREQLTLHSSTQAAHSARAVLVDLLGWDETRIRVMTPDVGGGFGPKVVFYQEDISTALASILTGRPVRWAEDRREHFIASTQERDQYWNVEIAVDDDGRVLGLRGSMIHDHGAYTARGINLAYNSALVVTLPYEIPAYRLDETGADQQGAVDAGPRGGPPARHFRDGADARPGGARTRNRSRGNSPQKPRSIGKDAVRAPVEIARRRALLFWIPAITRAAWKKHCGAPAMPGFGKGRRVRGKKAVISGSVLLIM